MAHIPQWQRELKNFIGIKSVFIIEGNVSDLYPVVHPEEEHEEEQPADFLPLNETLPHLFDEVCPGAYRFLYCDPLRGMHDPFNTSLTPALIRAATAEAERLTHDTDTLNPANKQQPFSDTRLVHNSLLIRAALTQRLTTDNNPSPSLACVYNFASRLTSSPTDLSAEENAVFLNLLIGSSDAIRSDGAHINTLILIVNKITDMPSWFFMNNPYARSLIIPHPDRETREHFITASFSDLTTPEHQKVLQKFIDVTDAMKVREIDELRRLYARGDTEPSHITDLVDIYKYGLKENRWATIAPKLHDNPLEILQQRVKGQDRALNTIVTVLKRSVMGFSGMQHSSHTKPKGVLFLAGPTGTGKTEAVKAVTELLFGDERSYIRFDMSEYAAENSDQKLFGAPPGYVGYDQGGQLTNAVKANPFSVILFDEVEKSHPSIMDKFLQILEDGRMTDGQGNTIYFSETLIFFTSNVGISEEILDQYGRTVGRRNIVEPGEPYEDIEKKVTAAMAAYFKPEVLNRIGNNIVVFDYINEEASRLIVEAQIRKINTNVEQQHGITIVAQESCLTYLERRALEPITREKGGRGIGNLVESDYLNPLAQFIFDHTIKAGDTVYANAPHDSIIFSADDQ